MSFRVKAITPNFNPRKYAAKSRERGDPDFVMSRSELVKFGINPRKWKMGGFVKESTDSMSHGSLVDCLLLTPELYEFQYEITPATYPGEKGETKWHNGAKYCKEWNDRIQSEGKTPIKEVELNSANCAIRRLMEDSAIRELIDNSEKQVMILADYDTGLNLPVIPFCGLLDIAPREGDLLADLKTTENASAEKYAKSIFEYSYHVQGSLYLSLWNAARPHDIRDRFVHIISENSSPFEPAKWELSQSFLQMGRERYAHLLARYAECLKSNFWPGYDDGFYTFQDHFSGGWPIIEPANWMLQSV